MECARDVHRWEYTRLPDDETARPSGLNDVDKTDEINGDVLLDVTVDGELELKQKVPPLPVYTLPAAVKQELITDGEADDFGVKSNGVETIQLFREEELSVTGERSSSSVADRVGDMLVLLFGEDDSRWQNSGLSVRFTLVGFSSFASLCELFESLLHRLTNDCVIVTMAMCEDMVVTVLTWFSSAANDVLKFDNRLG